VSDLTPEQAEGWMRWRWPVVVGEPRLRWSPLHRTDDMDATRTACDLPIPRRGEHGVVAIEWVSGRVALGSTRRCERCEAALR
jgi:hypothetical protein